MYAISLDGQYKQLLTNQIVAGSTHILPGGKRLLVYQATFKESLKPLGDYILDMEHNTLTSIEPPTGDCNYIYSPDLTMAALTCPDNEIYIERLQDHTRVRLTTLPREADIFFLPIWSPDGRWIAYFNTTGSDIDLGKPDPNDGLFVVETSCLSEPDTCPQKAMGPYKGNRLMYTQGPLVWSPDSRYLAMPSEARQPPIQIFDVGSRRFRFLEIQGEDVKGLEGLKDVVWSPDGQWLAYEAVIRLTNGDSESGIYTIPVAGGKSNRLVDCSGVLSFSFSIPAFDFQTGNTYIITKAGANLNVRDEPSVQGTILRKLQPGERVLLLGGPVEADGYSWRMLRVEADGTEGWAVENYDWYAPADQPQVTTSP